MPDVLYPVRAGESNDELRFSMRSLSANLPHGRVWMVGYKPSWVRNVELIDGGNSAAATRANLYHNLWLACRHSGLSDDIVIMNDDIFVVGPHPHPVPVTYRGTLAEQIATVTRNGGARGWWQQSLLATQAALTSLGYTDPLSYELHVPFPVNRDAMADTLERFAHITPHNPPQWRTLYGVVNDIGGVHHPDCKSVRPAPISRPYHSTDDMSWRYFRARYMQMFPQPSPYERPAADTRSLVSVTPRQHLRSSRRVLRT